MEEVEGDGEAAATPRNVSGSRAAP
jgi:hypothetical protein